jgi:hypothetical protein
MTLKNLEVRGYGLIKVLSLRFFKGLRKTMKTSVRIAGVRKVLHSILSRSTVYYD